MKGSSGLRARACTESLKGTLRPARRHQSQTVGAVSLGKIGIHREGALHPGKAGGSICNQPMAASHDKIGHGIQVVQFDGALRATPGFQCMLQTLSPSTGPDPGSELVAKSAGFSLHAGVNCEAHQLEKRERLCRCISRPLSPSSDYH